MKRKVYTFGKISHAVPIPREICKDVQINENTVFDVVLQDDGKITLTKLK